MWYSGTITWMKYKLHTLSSGLRLIVVPIPTLESATVTVWVGTGSRNETPGNSGISHFLEHMVFKGGAKRTTAREISEAVDSIGGQINASTSKEWTNFYIKARSANAETAFDVLSDIVLYPSLPAEDLEREKGVIVEEIGMYEDTPLWKIDDVFENLIYKGHPIGRDIIGTKDTVTSFDRSDFDSYRSLHYYPKNLVVTVAGGVTDAFALNLTKKYFGKFSAKKKSKKDSKFVFKQDKPQVLLSSKKKDQAHFILGFYGSEYYSKDRYAETVLAAILGGGMSSRLFTEIREKRGLAYSVRASRDSYSDCGYIGIYAGVDPKKALDAVEVSLKECYGISDKSLPVGTEELKKAKEYLKGNVALTLEDTKAVNAFFGTKAILGKVETPEELFAGIDKVTEKDIYRVAKKIFVKNRLNLAIIGPFKDSKKFERVIKEVN